MGRGKWNINEKEPFQSEFIKLYTLNELNSLHVYHTSMSCSLERTDTKSTHLFHCLHQCLAYSRCSRALLNKWVQEEEEEKQSPQPIHIPGLRADALPTATAPTPEAGRLKSSSPTALTVSYAPAFTITRGGRAGAHFSFLNINF